MRIDVTCPAGELAGHPVEALQSLADVAVADGADREDWMTKALSGAGATQVAVPVSREPRYQPVEDVTSIAVTLYDRIMEQAMQKVAARVDESVEKVDVTPYLDR